MYYKHMVNMNESNGQNDAGLGSTCKYLNQMKKHYQNKENYIYNENIMLDYITVLHYAKELGILPRVSKNGVKYIDSKDVDEKLYKSNDDLYLKALSIKEYSLSRTIEFEQNRLMQYNKDPQMKKALYEVRLKKLEIEYKKIKNILKIKKQAIITKHKSKSEPITHIQGFKYIPDDNLPCFEIVETKREKLNRQIDYIEKKAKERQELLKAAEKDYIQYKNTKISKVTLYKKEN